MIKKIILDSGLRILSVFEKNTKAVTILILVGTGSKYETEKENGISHFIEHMFGKGTEKRPSQLEIGQEIDKLGGRFNFGTLKEYTLYWVKVHFKHFDKALDWISDIFLNSRFDKREIEKEKGVIAQEINMYQDTPIMYISDLWEELLYPNQPAGRLISGTIENIKKLKKNHFENYLKEHYSSKNTIVCIAGKINPKIANLKVAKYFKNINKRKPKEKQKVIEKQEKPKVLLHQKETDQTHFCLGVRGVSFFHPLKYAQDLLAVILGGNMSSRLFNEIRAKTGLAYYIHTESGIYTDTGYLVSSAGVAHKNAEKVIKLILKEYKNLKTEKIKDSELQKAKDYIKGNLALSLESSDAKAVFYGTQELLKKEILSPEKIFKKIDKITKKDILKLAHQIFLPQKLNLALIGPFKQKKEFEKLLEI